MDHGCYDPDEEDVQKISVLNDAYYLRIKRFLFFLTVKQSMIIFKQANLLKDRDAKPEGLRETMTAGCR